MTTCASPAPPCAPSPNATNSLAFHESPPRLMQHSTAPASMRMRPGAPLANLRPSKRTHQQHEPITLAILDKLRTADFRDVHPHIASNPPVALFLQYRNSRREACSRVRKTSTRGRRRSPTSAASCWLTSRYTNRNRGAGETLERLYGPLLKYSVPLSKMLKKGTWLSNHTRYEEWYFGQGDPCKRLRFNI